MKRTPVILSMLLAFSLQAGDSIFNTANKAYIDEKYQESLILYDSIIKKGVESDNLYYNMGNSYYKIGDWPNAILHYEKCIKKNPGHTNAEYNLELANLKIIDRIEPLPQLFYKEWWSILTKLLPIKDWRTLAIIFSWTIFILTILNILFHKNIKKYIISTVILSLVFFTITLSSYKNIQKREIIIFDTVVLVKSAPTEKSTDLLSLHSGTKGMIKDSIGDWINIQLENGVSGWILRSSCKEI